MIPSQDICDNFEKQDARRVLWNPGVGEVSYVIGIIFPQVPSCCGTPFNSNRRFQIMRGQRGPPVNGGSEFNWHLAWYVIVLIPAVDGKLQGLLIVGNT